MNQEMALNYSRGMPNAAGAAMLVGGLIGWFDHHESISRVLVAFGMICIIFNAVVMYELKTE